jgi:hypothetical protein
MRVEVTAEDIRLGGRGEGANCPVARAVSRASGSPWVWVSDSLTGIFFCKEDADSSEFWDKALKKWDTPPAIGKIIWDYDSGRGMSPFSFEL